MIYFRLFFEKQFRAFQTIRHILIWNFIDVIDVFKSSTFGIVRRKFLDINVLFVNQFMQGSPLQIFTSPTTE